MGRSTLAISPRELSPQLEITEKDNKKRGICQPFFAKISQILTIFLLLL